MNDADVKVILGGLLHDIGKVVYRTGNPMNHSVSGEQFLREEVGMEDQEILDSVLYHHKAAIRNADLNRDSVAYITYIADNIASATDRRKRENEDYGFEMTLPLQPVFNILNENKKEKYYHPDMITDRINMPTDNKIPFTSDFYLRVINVLKDALKAVDWTPEYINSVLSAFEQTCSFVPSSTSKGEVADISLYDHVKLTGAFNSCIYQYLEENHLSDYKQELLDHEEEFYKKPVFLLYEIDLSGIQDFIYTIHTKDALKMLRARSFYLEIFMEHIVDMLLERLFLSRANLLYSGGGHCYMILPNTEGVKTKLLEFDREINQWLQNTFDVELYMATGCEEASAQILQNKPEGSYRKLFQNVSGKVGKRKECRYSASDILALNAVTVSSYEQECRVCKKLSGVNRDGLCPVCNAIKNSSAAIMTQPFFVILSKSEEGALPLPGDCYMTAESEEKLRKRMTAESGFVRAYAKNKYYTGLNVASKIWVADYTSGQTFEELAEQSQGIKRLAVLRADVDNLGQSFVHGFQEQYNTISRTAAFSRHLSMFFKYYLVTILNNGTRSLKPEQAPVQRSATVVYSGGDDLFLVGAWNDVLELSMDIRKTFQEYTEGALTLSAGIGIYQPGYPISQMAVETGELESDSKDYPGKNAVTIFPDLQKYELDGRILKEATYSWNEFEEKVVAEKYQTLKTYFDQSRERGKSFLYHLLELIRNRKDKINFARYVYLLSRLEPDPKADLEEKQLFRDFSEKMYLWIRDDASCRQLKTAIYIYAYMIREEEE